jgi:hypothetical protein
MTPHPARRVVCLRCDWSGAEGPPSCPRCEAGLYRAVDPTRASRALVRPSPVAGADTSANRSASGAPSPRREGEDQVRRWSWRLVATAVAVAVSIGGSWLALLRPATAPASRMIGVPRTGTLVYAVDDGSGWSRLWRWDLARGSVREGPRVREPLELVNSNGAQPGVVGVTSREVDGEQLGSLLRFLSPADRATPLVRGDLVTWGSMGASVVAVKRGPLLGACRRHLTIVIKTIVPALVERQYDRTLCGDIQSVGRDATTTYFTRRWHDQVDLVSAGYGRTHLVLSDYALLSISPSSDMLVVPADTLPPLDPALATVADPGDVPPGSVFGVSSFFQGLRGAPRPYRSGDDTMWVDRVLSWSRDSAVALVAGRLGDRFGVYEIAAGPGRRTEPPRWIGPIQGPTWATFADHGIAFVWTDERMFVAGGGALQPIALPRDAPPPEGPLVWIR